MDLVSVSYRRRKFFTNEGRLRDQSPSEKVWIMHSDQSPSESTRVKRGVSERGEGSRRAAVCSFQILYAFRH
ncbi:hypothetical protein ACFX10_017535 [Malus domestica]